jgi:hypothetical protein
LKHIDKQPDGLVARMLTTYSAATVGVYIGSLLHFVRFFRVNTQFLSGFCQLEELDGYRVLFENVQSAVSRRKMKQDHKRKLHMSDKTGDPAVLGRFLKSQFLRDMWSKLDHLHANPSDTPPSLADFQEIRNGLLVTLELLNARRTGDLTNMTIAEFRSSRITNASPDDHVVFVFEHKTATSSRCPVNFHGELYRRASQYIDVFGRRFQYSCQLMFPYVSPNSADASVKMTHSQFNVEINKLWSAYRSQSMDDEMPEKINSRFIRHSFVTAVHEKGDKTEMSEAAEHMSHSLATAKSSYDASLGVSRTIRTSRLFRQLLIPSDDSPGKCH